MRREMKVARLCFLGALVALAGCFSLARTEPHQQHFVLGSDAVLPDATTPATIDVAVGMRRPKLASYLASSFIVVRRGANQVDFAEFHRWGESLEEGINRVVAGALVAGGVREAAVAPWPARGRYDYVIQLNIVRFEGLAPDDSDMEDGGVLVVAAWEISSQLDGSVLAGGTTSYQRRGWTVGDFDGLVTLLDEGLGVLSDDLAASLRSLER